MATQGYRAQLPSSVVRRVVDNRPGVGSAIARGLADLGDAGMRVAIDNERIARVEEQQARASTVADGMGRLAQVQLDAEEEVQSLRDSTAPGAPGYAEQASEVYRRRWEDFEATLGSDPQVREHFAPMGARWIAGGVGQSRDWERQQRTQNMGEQIKTSLQTNAASLLSAPTVENYQSMITDFDKAIDMQVVDGNAKASMHRIVREQLTSSLFEGTLAQGNGAAVKSALESGKFDAWVGGAEGKARWLDRVAAHEDAMVRKAQAAEREAQQAAEDGLEAIKARVDIGEDVSQAEIEAALSQAKTAGVDEAKMTRFLGMGADAMSREAARAMTTRQLEQQLGGLEQRRAAGKATSADMRTLKAMDKELDARADKGALNLSALWKGGREEKAAAVAQLRTLRPTERYRVAGKLGGKIGVLASIPAYNAQTALRGAEIRKDRPDAFMPQDDNGKGQPREARNAFSQYLGLSLMNGIGGEYDAMLNTALDLYAGSMADAGDSGEWNRNEFHKAINIVFGATRREDGTIAGGLGMVRGRRIELPADWTAAEFDRGLAAQDFAGAVYADGSAVRKGDVLANYRPVIDEVSDDGRVSYRFEDERGRSLRRSGNRSEPWRLHVSRSARGND